MCVSVCVMGGLKWNGGLGNCQGSARKMALEHCPLLALCKHSPDTEDNAFSPYSYI